MVWLTETDIASFWTEKEQMGLDPDAVQGTMSKYRACPMELAEFKKEQIELLASNPHKHKGDRMPHPDQKNDDLGKIVPNPGLIFGIKLH